MRKIKFRAWSNTAKVMHPEWKKLDDENGEYILMQYTGLKDKNGKYIYEGDILLCDWDDVRYQPHNIGPVKWDTESACWDLGEGGSPWEDSKSHFKVIGNIYENPELLSD